MSKSVDAGGFRDRFALSEKGFRALIVGALWSMVGNFSLMLPVGVVVAVSSGFVGHLIDPSAPFPEPTMVFIVVVGVVALMACAQWVQYGATYNVVYSESARTRTSLAERLRKLPLAFFDRRDTADITTAVLTDCAAVEQVFSHVMPELWGTLGSTAVVAVVLAFLDWRMTVAMLWVVPVCFAALYATRRIQLRYGKRFIERRIAVASGIQECLEGMGQLHACGGVRRYMEGLDDRIDAAEKAQIASELVPGTVVSSVGLLLNVGKATTILVGSMQVIGGDLTFTAYVLFLIMAATIYSPLAVTFESTAELLEVRTHTERLQRINHEPVQGGAMEFHPNGHDIVFSDVGFSYEGSGDDGSGDPAAHDGDGNRSSGRSSGSGTVLEKVSFTTREGETTALVGASGSGKSTVSRLAARLWDCTSGTVTMGGVDVSTIAPEVLLRDYSIVFQNVMLFNDTVMNNIRLGRRGATDDEVLAAASAAQCDEFISRLPRGYDTVIGENGGTLSGGERQRLSIARALLKDVPIVLLDEATASLDAESETRVQVALSRLLEGKTVLVIAHRMRTVSKAHKVVVLDAGRIVEQGSPEELMRVPGGLFAHMVDLQKRSARWRLHVRPRRSSSVVSDKSFR